MNFLLDESAEFRLGRWLASQGHDVTAIARDYPHALSDREVLAIALREGRILITNDRDFGELIVRENLPHAGVIFFRLGAAGVDVKIERSADLLLSHADQLGRFIVVTPRGIRVRRPRES